MTKISLYPERPLAVPMNARQFLTKIPVPVCGLALGMASLDLFLSRTHGFYSYSIFAFLSFILIVMVTARFIIDPRGVAKDLENPAVFGVLPTYTMTLMLLATYAVDLLGDIALAIWLAAIVMSFVIMFFFVRMFLFGFSFEKVFPAWVVVFVGYVTASVTSADFGMQELGKILFWFGLIGYLAVLPLITYRTLVVRKIPEPLIPSIAIFAAPANLLVVGCHSAFGASLPEIPFALVAVMGAVSYIAVMIYMPVMLNRKFYPSYAALTFPLVISAVAFYRLGGFYGLSSGRVFSVLQETTVVIAVLVVVYVLIRYIIFFCRTARGPAAV